MNGGIDNANEEEGGHRSKGEREEILFRNFILSIFQEKGRGANCE